MLNINPGLVCDIITRARVYAVKVAPGIPETDESTSHEPDYLQILADHPHDLTYQEVRAAIDQLEPDQQYTLVALFYLGRGDFARSEWLFALKAAKQLAPEQIADYLLSKPQLPEFLEEGLAAWDLTCDDWEREETHALPPAG